MATIVIENVEDFARLLANAIADALCKRIQVFRPATTFEVKNGVGATLEKVATRDAELQQK